MAAPDTVSILIPAFNEEEALPQTVERLQRLPAGYEVLVVNVGGYVGESTRREIAHARSRGVLVSFLEPRADDHDADR